jgi:hypothetical protein
METSAKPSSYGVLRPVNAVTALILLLSFAIHCASHRAWADPALEQALASKDPKAAERVLKDADTAEPHLLMQASLGLLESGQDDKAVFWFHAGQLRARYWPKLRGDNAQIITIFQMSIGEQVNARAFRDIPALLRTLEGVVAWDEKTFPKWATAMKLDPAEPELLERRRKALEGIARYKEKLLAEREALEKYARQYKSPAQLDREQRESIKRNYSQNVVEINVAGTRFRVPANYLSPDGSVRNSEQKLTDIGFWIFLPDFGGYTRDNSQQPLRNPNVILVRVQEQRYTRPEVQVEDFLADGGAIKERVGDFEAAVYDSKKTRAPLPVNATSRHHVFKAVKANGGPYYVVCDAQSWATEEHSGCEMFLGDARRKLLVSALFSRRHVGRIAEIEKRLSAMLESWVVN